MQILISLYVPDPMMGILQAEAVVSMLKAGVTDAEGDGIGPTFFELHTVEDQWPHGDYRDETGNLLHVAQDHVIEATLAKRDAQQVSPQNMTVDEWIAIHGEVTFVGPHEHNHDGDDHDHGHDHNHGHE